jgi:hypothetical protein
MRKKITEKTVAGKAPGEIWDEYLPGFGLRIGKTKKTFFVMTRIDGKQRRLTVGNAAVITLGEARDKARQILRDAAKGIDPNEADRMGNGKPPAPVAIPSPVWPPTTWTSTANTSKVRPN